MRVTSSTVRAFGVAFLVALSGLSACGLINSDIAKVTFDLPPQRVSIDLASYHLPAGNTVAVPCGDGQVVAAWCPPPAGLPTVDCTTTPLLCLPNAQGTKV